MLVAVDDAEITKRWLCMRIGILARVIQKLPAFVTRCHFTHGFGSGFRGMGERRL